MMHHKKEKIFSLKVRSSSLYLFSVCIAKEKKSYYTASTLHGGPHAQSTRGDEPLRSLRLADPDRVDHDLDVPERDLSPPPHVGGGDPLLMDHVVAPPAHSVRPHQRKPLGSQPPGKPGSGTPAVYALLAFRPHVCHRCHPVCPDAGSCHRTWHRQTPLPGDTGTADRGRHQGCIPTGTRTTQHPAPT